jgi:hypothetical protein
MRLSSIDPRTALMVYKLVFVAFIIWASAVTVVTGAGLPEQPGSDTLDTAIRIVAVLEIVAAVAFLWKSLQHIAGFVLLSIFIVVAIGDGLTGGLPIRFALYISAVLLVLCLEPQFRRARHQGIEAR